MKLLDVETTDVLVQDSFNSRGVFSKASVMELAEDIKANGLIQPIVIAKNLLTDGPEKYMLVAGFRRCKAMQVLGSETIPAIFREDITELRQAILVNLSENIERLDLTFMQEAQTVSRLMKEGASIDECLKKLNKSRTWLTVRMQAMDLPTEIHEMIDNKIIQQSDIKSLHSAKRMDDDFCLRMAKKIKERRIKGITPPSIKEVQKTEKKVAKIRTRQEIFHLMGIIRKTEDECEMTTVLAWSAGEITTQEMYNQLLIEYKIKLEME